MTISNFSEFKTRLAESKKFAFGFWFSIFLDLVIIDSVIKFLVYKNDWPVFLNTQMLFSIPAPQFVIFFLYAVVAVALTGYLQKYFCKSSLVQQLAWIMIIAGGLSNIAERIIFGHVTDYIFIFNGVFNLADIYILLGLIILLVKKNS